VYDQHKQARDTLNEVQPGWTVNIFVECWERQRVSSDVVRRERRAAVSAVISASQPRANLLLVVETELKLKARSASLEQSNDGNLVWSHRTATQRGVDDLVAHACSKHMRVATPKQRTARRKRKNGRPKERKAARQRSILSPHTVAQQRQIWRLAVPVDAIADCNRIWPAVSPAVADRGVRRLEERALDGWGAQRRKPAMT
jgi:hypothetical protein